MPMQMKITTKGVTGAVPLLNEFTINLPRVLGAKPLDEYINITESNMQSLAPVRTGFLRANIQSYRIDQQTVAVTSGAPYSGYVDQGTYRMGARPFFSDNTFQSANLLSVLLADTGAQYLQILINKYQSMP
jgi:hypothetical protein